MQMKEKTISQRMEIPLEEFFGATD